jgi:hypothetical protein
VTTKRERSRVKMSDNGPHEPGLPREPGMALDAEEIARFGPAMRALPSDRWRTFVIALYRVPPGRGARVAACKAAGFGTTRTTAKTWAGIAHRLENDPRIQAAIKEEDQRQFRSLGPRAICAIRELVENPSHRDHARALGMVLDRIIPPEVKLNVSEERRLVVSDPDKVLERIAQLAAAAGISIRSLPPPSQPAAMIDVTPNNSDATNGSGG